MHQLDDARLYRLAVEYAPAGTRLHGVGEQGVPFKDIAEAIGAPIGLPVVSVVPEDAAVHFGFLSAFVAGENPTSSALTQELLGWQLQGPELIPDIEQGHHFKVRKGLGVGRKAMALQRPVRVDDYLSAHSITHEFDRPARGRLARGRRQGSRDNRNRHIPDGFCYVRYRKEIHMIWITQPVTLTLNDRDYTLDLDPRESLLDVLRERLDLTGTKKGCDQGACGACTVHIDGRRVLSCLTLAARCGGKGITTIEGVAGKGELHPLQQGFVEHDGLQCGYCTPGQIMSALALIGEGHAGSRAEIREWMSGNLCRCGAYNGIIEAIEQVRAVHDAAV